MPVDAAQFRQQLQRITSRISQAREWREQSLVVLRQALLDPPPDRQVWAERCRRFVAQYPEWGGAAFADEESLDQQFPFGAEPQSYALIAADGSQVLPDRHKTAVYAVIQAACACMTYGVPDRQAAERALAAGRDRKMELIAEDELRRDDGELVGAGEIGARRDFLEIRLLAQRCSEFRDAGLQPIGVADGSLVPFSLLAATRPSALRQALDDLKASLDRLRACGAIAAGYIDRPGHTALSRACALAHLLRRDSQTETTPREVEQLSHGILDGQLLEEDVLPAGFRTALFDPGWQVNRELGAHAIRSCYLNAGEPGQPIIARLDLPGWSAGPQQVGALAGVLRRHTRMGGGYPLALKAAHEQAVITLQDQAEIENAIDLELMSLGYRPSRSRKQEAKDHR